MRIKAIIFFITVFSFIANAQENLEKVLSRIDTVALNRLSLEWEIRANNDLRLATEKARLNSWDTLITSLNGRRIQLVRLDEEGNPVYISTNNNAAAITTRTNKVHSGGGAGLNLEGNGFVIGIWDEGSALETHEQLNGRVTIMDGSSDNDHATHVGGTLIGDGTGINSNSINAKGMAPQANLNSYDWTNEGSEMTTFSMTGLISNHSYGYATGWVPTMLTPSWQWFGGTANLNSSGEDPLFGNYTIGASNWDNLANMNPNYLIVKAAGNSRNVVPPFNAPFADNVNPTVVYDNYDPTEHPGPNGVYDCIDSKGVAKNILTVAAVEDVPNYTGPSSVTMSSFSSFGPTDDGRIKPDISANGVGVYSSINGSNDFYASLDGTSMACPNVAGSAILLQEHFEDINGSGNFMLASTLKAVIIHTADETGSSPGPDYEFGWGLMNTEAAANLITEDGITNAIITENTLINNGNYSITFESSGNKPVEVTIVWNDPPGLASNSTVVDDNSLKLINDLDLSLATSVNTYLPYILDPSNPSNPATTGDNFRDNVEKIYLQNPLAGSYTLSVSHKNNLLNGSQDFSLIISGATFQTEPNLFCENGGNFSINPTNLNISNVEIGNNGSSTPFDSKLGYYLSNTPFITPNQHLIGEDYIPSLANGDISIENATITPNNIISMPSDGTYYFGMYIDHLYEINESNEADNNDCYFTNQLVTVGCTDSNAHNYSSNANFDNNNCETCNDGIQNGDETGIDCGGVLCAQCTAGLPNLYCEDGGDFSINSNNLNISNVEIGNNGSSTPLDSKLGYYLSNTPFITPNQHLIGEEYVPSLANGDISVENATINHSNITSMPPDGTYYFGMYIDHLYEINESDEADNNDCYFTNQLVTVGCTDSNAHNYSSNANFDNNNCETCNDGIQNGDETGIDCGGSLCPTCCPITLTINDVPIPNGIYNAEVQLNSQGEVDPNSDVIFKAGTNILLKDGFKANNYFKATIEGCPQ